MRRYYYDICCGKCLHQIKHNAIRCTKDDLSLGMSEWNLKCPECGYPEAILIDSMIYPTIKILNDGRIQTTASCQGHIYTHHYYKHRYEYYTPYILFAKVYPVIYTEPFPEGWELNQYWIYDETDPRVMLGLYYRQIMQHRYPDYILLEDWARRMVAQQ